MPVDISRVMLNEERGFLFEDYEIPL